MAPRWTLVVVELAASRHLYGCLCRAVQSMHPLGLSPVLPMVYCPGHICLTDDLPSNIVCAQMQASGGSIYDPGCRLISSIVGPRTILGKML